MELPGSETTEEIFLQNSIEQDEAVDAQQAEASQVLSEIECRVLGALMEKQLSTPDSYPLTISSLLSAVNLSLIHI